ncbi:hypothetical protein TcasGA2_TC013768 [Tribolium castaneum]|uniref:Uncharacterized protein n=1 Tax=Tribolium castaneum TaxID=7070 RepID=D6WJI5_TRICA|nr:hypothetical protein TcasGA2_TC013768 [Tribolium castaneum]
MSRSSHKELRHSDRPQSSRDLSLLTNQELDHLRRSNATLRLSRWESFKLFFWNGEDRTVCFRTGTSWLFIMTFYPLFVALILCLFYGTMVLMVFCIKTYAKRPVINKNSLTKEPTYF